jgi:hypothetical protein
MDQDERRFKKYYARAEEKDWIFEHLPSGKLI